MGTLAAPLTLPLLLVQALTGERVPDVVTPLVEAVYGGGRAGRAAVRMDVDVADTVAEGHS